MTSATALITGFEPYAGRGINPAAEIVRSIDGEHIDGLRISAHTLPVAFNAVEPHIERLLDELQPVMVISLGLWPGAATLRLERVGINIADCDIDDNEGVRYRDRPLRNTGPAACMATLPIRAIEQQLLASGIPVEISNSAGSYLCNAVLYGFLTALAERRHSAVPCGFIHVPYLPAQVATLLTEARQSGRCESELASMDLNTLLRALRLTVEVTRQAGNREA